MAANEYNQQQTEIRRRNLKKWIDKYFDGVQAKFLAEVDISQGELSLLLKDRVIGERKARKIEELANMPAMWLDNVENDNAYYNAQSQQINHNHGNNATNIFSASVLLSQTPKAEAIWENVKNIAVRTLPILDIDQAVVYILSPELLTPAILDQMEKAATAMPHSNSTVCVKMSDDFILQHEMVIKRNEILIIDPKIPPRNNDIVLVCLDFANSKRGLVAQLEVSLDGQYFLRQAQNRQLMPKGACICGVVLEVQRRLIDTDIATSRRNLEWDILNTAIS